MKIARFGQLQKSLVVLACAVSLTSVSAAAEISARPMAMGGAYTALSTDTPLFYNPAGLGLTSFDLTTSLSGWRLQQARRLFQLAQNPLDAAEDIHGSGYAGLSLGSLGMGLVADGAIEQQASGKNKLISADWSANYAVGAAFRPARNVWVGLGANRIWRKSTDFAQTSLPDDKLSLTMQEKNSSGYAFSLGIIAKITDLVSLGLSANNLASTMESSATEKTAVVPVGDVANPQWQSRPIAAEAELLPTVYRGGVALTSDRFGITLALDAATDASLHYGLEKNFLWNFLSLRAGQVVQKGRPAQTTAGVGMNLGPIRFSASAATEGGFRKLNGLLEAAIRF